MTRRKKPEHGPQRAALEAAVAALVTGPQHAALIESCRAIADFIDGCPVFDDKAWREYRLALKALYDHATGGGDEDDFDREFDELRTTVGDAAKP